jgi:hypothetical protein
MTPPVQGADFLAALVASALLGAFPPVDFLAVCFVRAMLCFVCAKAAFSSAFIRRWLLQGSKGRW